MTTTDSLTSERSELLVRVRGLPDLPRVPRGRLRSLPVAATLVIGMLAGYYWSNGIDTRTAPRAAVAASVASAPSLRVMSTQAELGRVTRATLTTTFTTVNAGSVAVTLAAIVAADPRIHLAARIYASTGSHSQLPLVLPPNHAARVTLTLARSDNRGWASTAPPVDNYYVAAAAPDLAVAASIARELFANHASRGVTGVILLIQESGSRPAPQDSYDSLGSQR